MLKLSVITHAVDTAGHLDHTGSVGSLEHRTSVADEHTEALHRPAEAGTVRELVQRADTRSVVAVVRPCVVAS